MEIPIFENQTAAGTLRAWRQGLYIRFEARLPGEGEELCRLWLSDSLGKSASLGLLEPGRGERRLCRRLTSLELQKLPPRPWTALVLPANERPSKAEPAEAPVTLAVKAERAAQDPPSIIPHSGSNWLRLPDGSLFEPAGRLLALPWGGGDLPPGVAKIRLEGRDYWVFHT